MTPTTMALALLWCGAVPHISLGDCGCGVGPTTPPRLPVWPLPCLPPPTAAWQPAVGRTDRVKSQAMELNRSERLALNFSSLFLGVCKIVRSREPQPRTPASAHRLVWAGCWGMLLLLVLGLLSLCVLHHTEGLEPYSSHCFGPASICCTLSKAEGCFLLSERWGSSHTLGD